MIYAKQALLASGWADDVRVSVLDGRISGLKTGGALRMPTLTSSVFF